MSDATNSPTAWFAVLESARERNDFERAGEAVKQLRRLGVEVKFTRQGNTKQAPKSEARK